jgi:hypothetical protein
MLDKRKKEHRMRNYKRLSVMEYIAFFYFVPLTYSCSMYEFKLAALEDAKE